MAACDMGKWDGMVTRWDTIMGTCLCFSLLVVGSGLIICLCHTARHT